MPVDIIATLESAIILTTTSISFTFRLGCLFKLKNQVPPLSHKPAFKMQLTRLFACVVATGLFATGLAVPTGPSS